MSVIDNVETRTEIITEGLAGLGYKHLPIKVYWSHFHQIVGQQLLLKETYQWLENNSEKFVFSPFNNFDCLSCYAQNKN